MNAITPVPSASIALVPHDMNSAMKLAEMMATGKLIPQHLQRNPGDCLMVVEQALRWGMSPFAVAQCTSVISSKLMFEGKLVAAALHSSGILSGRLDYEFSGEGDDREVTVRATLRGESKSREVTVKIKEVKTNNQYWTRQPDQQLVYASTRVWARRYAPEVMLGVYSPEEFDAPISREGSGVPVIEGRAEPMPSPPPPRRRTMAEAIGDDIPEHLSGAPDDALGMGSDPSRPSYPLMMKGGGRMVHTGSEWIEAWERVVRNYQAADARNKLKGAHELNKPAIQAVREFDPQAAIKVEKMIEDALDDGGAAHEPENAVAWRLHETGGVKHLEGDAQQAAPTATAS